MVNLRSKIVGTSETLKDEETVARNSNQVIVCSHLALNGLFPGPGFHDSLDDKAI